MEVNERTLLNVWIYLYAGTFFYAFFFFFNPCLLHGVFGAALTVFILQLVSCTVLLHGEMLLTVLTKKKKIYPISLGKTCKVSCQHSFYLMAVKNKEYKNNNKKVRLKAGILGRKLKMKYFQFVGLCLSTVCLDRLCQAPFLLQSLLWSSFIYISLCHRIRKDFSMTAPSHVLLSAKPILSQYCDGAHYLE